MKKRKFFAIIAAVCSLSCMVLGISACKQPSSTKEVINGEKTKTELSYEQLSATSLTLRIGETKTLTSSVEILSWTTDDANVATVQGGVVTSVAEGVTFVRATSINGETLSCLVNVTDVAFAPQITLSFSSKTLRVGDEWTLTADVTVDGGKLSDKVAWSKTSDAVSMVNKEDNVVVIKAIAPGETTVYATLGGTVVSCTLMVKASENAAEGVFSACEEMKNAPLTQVAFGNAIKANSEYETTGNVSVYQQVYYGEYENNAGVESNSLVAYATLSSAANKPLCLDYEGYYAYGMLVSVSQSHSETMSAYAEQTYRFYASESANEDGQYGIFIQDALQGHYLVRAFVEYQVDGQIVTEISENEVGAGDLRYEIVGEANDFTVMINDSKCMSYGTSCEIEDVDLSLTDIYGVTVKAMYATILPDKTDLRHYNAPKFRFNTGLTKELIKALRAEGYSTLSFYTMLKTEETEYMSVNVLDEQADFSSALVIDSATEVNPRLISSVTNGESNVWYYVEYSLEFLFDNYDLLFAQKTNYPFMDIDRVPITGGTFYLSDFMVNRSESLIKEQVRVTINGSRIEDAIVVAKTGDVVDMSDTTNDYIYTVNGKTLVEEYVLDEEGVYVFTAQPTGENIVVKYEIIVGNGTAVSKLVDVSDLTVGTSDDQVYYHAPGYIKKYATYQGEQEITFKKPEREEYGARMVL